MSEPTLAVLAPALDSQDSIRGLERLRQANLPNGTKYLVTNGRMEVGGSVETLNVAAGYPAEPAHLQTLAAWAGMRARSDARYRDGHAIYCARRLLDRIPAVDYLLLLNGAAGLSEQWHDRRAEADAHLVTSFGQRASEFNLLLKTSEAQTIELLELLWSLYHSGSVYGIVRYSLAEAVRCAQEALRLSSVARCKQSP